METLPPEEALDILATSRLGVLAMSHEDRAYAIPIFFAYDGDHIWMHCHPGLKDQYLAHTQEVCLVVSHVDSANIWESVQVFGRAEKATLNTDIDAAKAALAKVPFPPAEGNFPKGLPVRSDAGIYYLKLTPSHVEGKKSAFRQ